MNNKCKYCELGVPLIIGENYNDDRGIAIQYPHFLNAYGYDPHGPTSNGLVVHIKYCPMCGKKLD